MTYQPTPRPTRHADAAVSALLSGAGAVLFFLTLAIVYVVITLVLT